MTTTHRIGDLVIEVTSASAFDKTEHGVKLYARSTAAPFLRGFLRSVRVKVTESENGASLYAEIETPFGQRTARAELWSQTKDSTRNVWASYTAGNGRAFAVKSETSLKERRFETFAAGMAAAIAAALTADVERARRAEIERQKERSAATAQNLQLARARQRVTRDARGQWALLRQDYTQRVIEAEEAGRRVQHFDFVAGSLLYRNATQEQINAINELALALARVDSKREQSRRFRDALLLLAQYEDKGQDVDALLDSYERDGIAARHFS